MADVLPELEHLLEATPDGFRFRTKTRSVGAIGGMTTFGLVVGGFIAVPSFFFMFLSPGCCIFVFVGVLLMVVAPFAGSAMRTVVTVDITHEGLRENTFMGQEFTWKHVEALKLVGDERKRAARLKAGSYEIMAWKALQADADEGWTVDRVRWFANAIQAFSGVELIDELPDADAFRALEAEKQAKLADRRAQQRQKRLEKNREAFPMEHDAAVVPATTRTVTDPEGTAYVLDRGQQHRPGKRTSTTEEQPVRIDDDAVVVGRVRAAFDDIAAVYVLFEEEDGQVDGLLIVEHRSGKLWKVARRGAEGAGLLLGVAADLEGRIVPSADS